MRYMKKRKQDKKYQVDFVNRLIEVSEKKDKEFTKFINENLFPKKSKLNIEEISKNIDAVKTMNDNQRIIMLGMVTQLKESYNPPKFFTPIIAIFGMVFILYRLLIQYYEHPVIYIISSIVLSGLILYSSRLLKKSFSIYPTAVYFDKLMSECKG